MQNKISRIIIKSINILLILCLVIPLYGGFHQIKTVHARDFANNHDYLSEDITETQIHEYTISSSDGFLGNSNLSFLDETIVAQAQDIEPIPLSQYTIWKDQETIKLSSPTFLKTTPTPSDIPSPVVTISQTPTPTYTPSETTIVTGTPLTIHTPSATGSSTTIFTTTPTNTTMPVELPEIVTYELSSLPEQCPQDLTQQDQTSAPAGAGRLHTGVHVSTVRDVTRVFYTHISSGSGDASDASQPILLIKPVRMDNGGVYIWRDQNGVWQLQIVGNDSLDVTGQIRADDFGCLVANGGSLVKKENGNLELHASQKGGDVRFEFIAIGPVLEFDLSINGEHKPNLVYLGVKSDNPSVIPFQIENQPLVLVEPSVKKKSESKSPQPYSEDTSKGGGSSDGRNNGGAQSSILENRPIEEYQDINNENIYTDYSPLKFEPRNFLYYLYGNVSGDSKGIFSLSGYSNAMEQGAVFGNSDNLENGADSIYDDFDYEFNTISNNNWVKQDRRWDIDETHWVDLKPEHVYTDGSSNLILKVPQDLSEGGQIDSTKKDFSFGSYRVRLKTSAVSGVVNAFFFYSTEQVEIPGEIDIEFLSNQNGDHLVNFVIHPRPNPPNDNHHIEYDLGFDPSQDFHTYGFDWYQDRVVFFVDDIAIGIIMGSVPDHEGLIIISNWTGNPSWGGGPPHDDAFYYVDWFSYTAFEDGLPNPEWFEKNLSWINPIPFDIGHSTESQVEQWITEALGFLVGRVIHEIISESIKTITTALVGNVVGFTLIFLDIIPSVGWPGHTDITLIRDGQAVGSAIVNESYVPLCMIDSGDEFFVPQHIVVEKKVSLFNWDIVDVYDILTQDEANYIGANVILLYLVPKNIIQFSEIGTYRISCGYPDGWFSSKVEELVIEVEPDTTPPMIISHRFESTRDTNIYVTFNENMDETKLTNDNLVILGSLTGDHQAVYSFNHNTYELTINPVNIFSYGEIVAVVINTGVTDFWGNHLTIPYTFDFEVGEEPPPAPTSLSVSAALSPDSTYAYSVVNVSGSVTYNTGANVPVGTVTINTGENEYTAAINNGSFSQDISAPSLSRNISITVEDDQYNLNKTVQRWITIQGNGNTPGYDLSTTVVYDYNNLGNGYVEYWYKDAFRTTDDFVDLLAYFDNINIDHDLDLMWQFYRPNGDQYGSDLVKNNSVEYWWEWGWHSWGFLVDGHSMSYNPGRYKIKFFVDGDKKATHYYVVAWDFTEHRMSKGVQGSDLYMPIDETNVFYQTDDRAYTWANFDLVAQGTDLKAIFYEPSGAEYAEVNSITSPDFTLSDPGGSHTWWDWYRAWAWIGIQGNSAAQKTGEWHLEFFVKNPTNDNWDLYYDDYFQILENPDVVPESIVSILPEYPIETQIISFDVSASDNSYLSEVVLYWNDGTLHSEKWSSLYSSSFNATHSIISYMSGQQIEYWTVCSDTSGNQYESEHHIFTVISETVSSPFNPLGFASRQVDQSGEYSTGGSSTSLNNNVEYQFDWGDNQQSNWGNTTQTHSWNSEGVYTVKARARSQSNHDRVSDWSSSFVVTIDSSVPVIEISTNSGNDFSTEQSQITLDGIGSDPQPSSNLSMIIINTEETNQGTLKNWQFSLNLLAGKNSIMVTAIDNAGNQGQDTINITLISSGPEIDIQRPLWSSIADGGVDNIGNRPAGRLSLIYTVDNSAGTAQLDVTDVTAASLINTSSFSVDTVLPINVAAGATASVDVSFDVDGVGPFSMDIDLANNDDDENPYDISIEGVGTEADFFEPFDYTNGTVPPTIAAYKVGGSVRDLDVQDGKLKAVIDTTAFHDYTYIFWKPVDVFFGNSDLVTIEFEGFEQTGYNEGGYYGGFQITTSDYPLDVILIQPGLSFGTQNRYTSGIYAIGYDSLGNPTDIARDMYNVSDGTHDYKLELNHVNGSSQLGAIRFYRDGVLEASSDDISTFLAPSNTVRFFVLGDNPVGALSTWDDVSVQIEGSPSVLINEIDMGSPDRIELYNYGTMAVDLTDWEFESSAFGETTIFIIPQFTLPARGYVILDEEAGTNTSTHLYFDDKVWLGEDFGGMAALYDEQGNAIDFVRWADDATPPPSGTDWFGTNPTTVPGKTSLSLGRDQNGYDTDYGSDWCLQHLSIGSENTGCEREDTIGMYSRTQKTWYLKDANTDGWTNVSTVRFGSTLDSWIPVEGDWNGDGTDTIGMYSRTQKTWYLKDANIDGWGDVTTVRFGSTLTSWIPVVGDWDGDGTDTIGMYSRTQKTWYLKDNNTDGWGDVSTVRFGSVDSSWIPVVGDWDDDGIDEIGMYSRTQKTWYLKDANDDGWANVSTVRFGSVDTSWIPAVGDWDGDGTDKIGMYSRTQKTWYLKDDNIDGWGDVSTVRFGSTLTSWIPVTGKW